VKLMPSHLTLRFMPEYVRLLSGTTEDATQIDCVTDQFPENTLLISYSIFRKLRYVKLLCHTNYSFVFKQSPASHVL